MQFDWVTFIVQGGFAAAFFWLLVDTRKESAKREDRLMTALESYNRGLQKISELAEQMRTRVEARHKE